MSKYRQDKTLKEQEKITENLDISNNVGITLHDIYSTEALENYLGFWKAYDDMEEEGEEEEEGSDEDW